MKAAPRLETIGVKALYRFTAADAPVGIGLQLGLGVDGHAALSEIEARLIVETRERILVGAGQCHAAPGGARRRG